MKLTYLKSKLSAFFDGYYKFINCQPNYSFTKYALYLIAVVGVLTPLALSLYAYAHNGPEVHSTRIMLFAAFLMFLLRGLDYLIFTKRAASK